MVTVVIAMASSSSSEGWCGDPGQLDFYDPSVNEIHRPEELFGRKGQKAAVKWPRGVAWEVVREALEKRRQKAAVMNERARDPSRGSLGWWRRQRGIVQEKLSGE
jgi:hypothetical protein